MDGVLLLVISYSIGIVLKLRLPSDFRDGTLSRSIVFPCGGNVFCLFQARQIGCCRWNRSHTNVVPLRTIAQLISTPSSLSHMAVTRL